MFPTSSADITKFKFADEKSRINFDLARKKLPDPILGFIPMVVINGPSGTGKSTLARHLACEIHGLDATSLASHEAPKSEGHWRTLLDHTAAHGDKVLLIQGVSYLRAPQLEAFITSREWCYRVMHSQNYKRVPCETLVIVTGRKVTLSEALNRRARIINLTL